MIKLNKIKANPDNPRVMRDAKFDKLLKSMLTFPQMLSLRPMVIADDNITLGGNMRYRVYQHIEKMSIEQIKDFILANVNDDKQSQYCIKYWTDFKDTKLVEYKHAKDLTDDQKKEFAIKDNVNFGDWDYDELANSWDATSLEDWGLDVWTAPEYEETDYSDKNKEIDVDDLSDDMIIKLKYDAETYWKIKEKLNEIDISPEDLFTKALEL